MAILIKQLRCFFANPWGKLCIGLVVAISLVANQSTANGEEAAALKYGYIDKTGKLVIPAQFDGAGTFTDGPAAVRNILKKPGTPHCFLTNFSWNCLTLAVIYSIYIRCYNRNE